MKTLAALSLAAVIVAAAATGASAVPQVVQAGSHQATMVEGEGAVAWDPCHGQSAGTAHPLCGTATGGPAGGLF